MSMRHYLLALLPLLSTTLASAQESDTSPAVGPYVMAQEEKHGDKEYQPEVGQSGKDVIWVPTPDALVKEMLTVAKVTPEDYVVDLGSGDGRIAIAAARDFGAQALGIEYNRKMVALAQRQAAAAGVTDKVRFMEGDIFKTDFSDATVVTMYLLSGLNLRLRPTLLKMDPGTRIVSHAFTMGDWEPDQTIDTDAATGYFWIVPAQVEGRWNFTVDGEQFTAHLQQEYQMLQPGANTPFTEGRLRGTAITLSRKDGAPLQGEVKSDTMAGEGWSAKRVRAAN